jgi:hypothetical protein
MQAPPKCDKLKSMHNETNLAEAIAMPKILKRRNNKIYLTMIAALITSIGAIGSAHAAQGSLSVQMALPAVKPASSCGLDPWLHLIESFAWPIAIIALAFWFREPLSQFAAGLSGRIQKLSVFNVAVELATAQQSASRTPLLEEIRDPTRPAFVPDSARGLIRGVQSAEPADFSPIFLGTGDEWLTSRLYLATVMMERMRGIKAFVFLDRTAESERHFVAVVDVRLLRWRLARRYPWLEAAYAGAYAQALTQNPPIPMPSTIISDTGALEPGQAEAVAQRFIASLQRNTPVPSQDSEWTWLDRGVEERATWVTRALLTELLPTNVFAAKVDEMDDQPRVKRSRAVLRKPEAYVALVDRHDQFLSLVDRRAYLEILARSLGEEPE